jgi:hypothetical protein
MGSFRRGLAASLVALSLALLSHGCGTADSASNNGGGGSGGEACGNVILDGKGGIPLPPDGASLCPAGACNYQSQDGCPADQGCRPYYAGATTPLTPQCEATGAGRSGDTCTASTQCARGYLCAADPTGSKTCHKQCCGGDWSACDAGESCIREYKIQFPDGHTEAAGDLCFPVNNCDPLDPASCANEPNRECKIADPTGNVACSPKSAAQLGESCAPPNVCAQGLTCVGKPAVGEFCRRLCRALECGEPSCEPSEGSCVHFDRDPPGVGECTPGR